MSLKYCLTSLIIFSACESTIDINSPDDYTSSLAIRGEFNPDSIWSVEISQSLPLNSSLPIEEYQIKDATVTIKGESGRQETLIHTKNGVYLSELGTRPIIGEEYRLDVSSPGFASVYAISHAPMLKSTFLDLQDVSIGSQELPIYRIRFSVTDLSGRSFYQLLVYQVFRSCLDDDDSVDLFDNPDGVPALYLIRFDSSDPSLFDSFTSLDRPPVPFNQYYGTFFTGYFSDKLFENETREFEIFTRPPYISEIDSDIYFKIVVTSLNEDLVLWSRSITIQDDYLTGTDPILLGTPTNVYSNIQGGLGIFSGSTNHTYLIDSNGNEWTENEIGLGSPLPLCD
ncbi:MAG: DUF4249 family protein [Bacteroidetes bacterium]|nr:DUF4249 family protein [Bacteroidota bacterium]